MFTDVGHKPLPYHQHSSWLSAQDSERAPPFPLLPLSPEPPIELNASPCVKGFGPGRQRDCGS